MKITASVLFVLTLAITLCAPARAQQATITGCKPGTGVRLYKHFISLRASGRLKCGSTVEVLRYMRNGQTGQGMAALVRQGTLQGYVQPWHINFGGTQANTAPQSAFGTLMSAIAQGLQAYGNSAMTPSERLARTCLATPGCSLEAQTGQQWSPVTEPQQVEAYPQGSTFRVFGGNSYYTATVVQPSGMFRGHPLPSQSAPALILDGGGMSLAIVNGYAYTLGTDGQWRPTGLGSGQPQGVQGTNP